MTKVIIDEICFATVTMFLPVCYEHDMHITVLISEWRQYNEWQMFVDRDEMH